jgi:hypothetical protein
MAQACFALSPSARIIAMKRIVLSVFAIAIAAQSASADTAAGQRALALAALVAAHSPLLSGQDKHAIARLFGGDLNVHVPTGRKIAVKADAVLCRASNVDITSRSCTLTFGKHTATLKGRHAHELFATIAEVGVPEDGAAGSVFAGLSNLDCAIDPTEIKQKAGGGANCTFNPGAAK